MSDRISFKDLLSPEGTLDVSFRNHVLFGERMAQDRDVSSMEEIQDPIVHPASSYSQFVNAISQHIRERSPQLVSVFFQMLDGSDAKFVSPHIRPSQVFQPIQYRDVIAIFLVEDDFGAGHADTVSQVSFRRDNGCS